MALILPSTLTVINTLTGARVWKHDLPDRLCSFSLDPFDCSRLALVSTDSFVFLDDINTTKAPVNQGKRFQLAPQDDDGKNKTRDQIVAAAEGMTHV